MTSFDAQAIAEMVRGGLVDAADEVVAVLEARASQSAEGVIDRVRRRVLETSGLELDRILVAPPGTVPVTIELDLSSRISRSTSDLG